MNKLRTLLGNTSFFVVDVSSLFLTCAHPPSCSSLLYFFLLPQQEFISVSLIILFPVSTTNLNVANIPKKEEEGEGEGEEYVSFSISLQLRNSFLSTSYILIIITTLSSPAQHNFNILNIVKTINIQNYKEDNENFWNSRVKKNNNIQERENGKQMRMLTTPKEIQKNTINETT
jgi:hypothetical protein